VTPVPLHSVRRRERGYNQSELLAAHLALLLDAPLVAALVRPINTPPQAGLSRERRLSMRVGAFRPSADLSGLGPVLLVDDVVTTGATLAAAAEALSEAAASEVVCFAAAGTR
jgi:predicted amidophosphoribosyltransferase